MSVSAAFRQSLVGNLDHSLSRSRVLSFSELAARAQKHLLHLAEAGIDVKRDVRDAILKAASLPDPRKATDADKEALYASYTQVCRLASKVGGKDAERDGRIPFDRALDDAEHLLKHAAETGDMVSKEICLSLLKARTASDTGALSEQVQTDFYASYSTLSAKFGDVTAETINVGASKTTSRYLIRYTYAIVAITILVAAASIFSFVADAVSARIDSDITSSNELAAKLRRDLTTPDGTPVDLSAYADKPCSKIGDPDGPNIDNLQTIEQLQAFTAGVREIRTSADKLDWMMFLGFVYLECDPYGSLCKNAPNTMSKEELAAGFQLNPAIINLPAEVLCKIQFYQEVRNFANNVRTDYVAIFGAISAYALPIAYALLGAMAFQLRLFADRIRRRTYTFSFAEPARLVTAVIAGAICGLFNPAQNLSLSPLAIAFLVGYGVELFFKFLDTLINAFGPNAQVTQVHAGDRSRVDAPLRTAREGGSGSAEPVADMLPIPLRERAALPAGA